MRIDAAARNVVPSTVTVDGRGGLFLRQLATSRLLSFVCDCGLVV